MSWPTSPINGQQVDKNGITFQYDSANSVWNRIGQRAMSVNSSSYTTDGLTVQGNTTTSNLAVSINAIVTGNITAANANLGNLASANYIAGALTTAAQPNITSTGTLTSLGVSGLTTLSETTELVATPVGTTYDCANGSVFYLNQPGADFTPNFTNVPTTDNRISIVTIIINQSGTPGLPLSIQINSSSQTIKWLSGTTPTGVASSLQTIAFCMLRIGGAWVVSGTSGAFI